MVDFQACVLMASMKRAVGNGERGGLSLFAKINVYIYLIGYRSH